jgi:hypothetical protein
MFIVIHVGWSVVVSHVKLGAQSVKVSAVPGCACE